jgi:hypothetical protein
MGIEGVVVERSMQVCLLERLRLSRHSKSVILFLHFSLRVD